MSGRQLWIPAGIIAILVIVFLVNSSRRSLESTVLVTPAPASQDEDSSQSGMAIVPGSSALYIVDQPPEEKVTVSTVFLAEPGFIIIYSSTAGIPEEVIGVSEYIVGAKDMVEIVLDRPLLPNQDYIAILHKDDGNKIWDSVRVDIPIILEDQPVMMSFSVAPGSQGEVPVAM